MRNFFEGMKSLAETLTDRENIARDILAQLDSATDPWGIKVHKKYAKLITVSRGL